jgi:general secretion pathway protein A
MLSNFQQNGKPLLQSFLLGQAELQPILRAPNMEQFRQRIVASCHLAPLNYEETSAYIKYRLEHAGSVREDLFDEDAFKAIHKFTTGVPRKINTLMDRVLLYGFLEELERFTKEDVENVIEEVQAEMFVPDEPVVEEQQTTAANVPAGERPVHVTPNGNVVQDAQYYKEMLEELVDALDDAIKHKVKLTQYIDKLLKKKYQTYVRLKSDDGK